MGYVACDFSSFSAASIGINALAKRLTPLLSELSKSTRDSLSFHFHSLNGSWKLRTILLNLYHDKVCRLRVKSNRKTIHALLHTTPPPRVESESIFTATSNCLMSPHSSLRKIPSWPLAGPNPLSFTHRNNIPDCQAADMLLSAGCEWKTGTSALTFQPAPHRNG